MFDDDSSVLRSLGSLPYNPNAASESSTYCINSFRRSAQIRSALVTTQDYTFTAPNWPEQYNEYGKKLAYQRPEYEIFDYARTAPDWGPKKIRAWLMNHRVSFDVPAASTIGDIVKDSSFPAFIAVARPETASR